MSARSLFEFVSSLSGYTCDYTDQDGGTYQEVRVAMNEVRESALPRALRTMKLHCLF